MAMVFGVYWTFEEFFRRACPEEELIRELQKYSAPSILYFCLRLNTELRLWTGGVGDESTQYPSLVRYLYPGILGDTLLHPTAQTSPVETRRVVFHTLQILHLSKLAIQHCAESGKDFLRTPLQAGLILLKVNDQLYFRDRAARIQSEPIRDLHTMADLIASGEAHKKDGANLIVRAYRMFVEISVEMKYDADYFDFDESFRSVTGLDISTYLGMCLALYVADVPAYFKRVGNALTYPGTFWDQTTFSAEEINAFWKCVSANVELMRQTIGSRNKGATDFSAFRLFPLLHVPPIRFGFDLGLILEKGWSGIYWSLFYADPKNVRRLPRLVGKIFECYFNSMLASQASELNNIVSDPCWQDDQTQVTDAVVISGESLILIECKGIMMTAAAKYGGDVQKLRLELELKFVRSDRSQPKGVSQLARVVRDLEAGRDTNFCIDWKSIKQIYSLIVTSDGIGETLVASRVLNRYFQQELGALGVADQRVQPLLITGISTMELVIPSLASNGLGEILTEWQRNDPNHRGSLLASTDSDKWNKTRGNPDFERIAELLMARIKFIR